MDKRCPVCGQMLRIISSVVVVENNEAFRKFFRGCLNEHCAKFKQITVENKVKISE